MKQKLYYQKDVKWIFLASGKSKCNSKCIFYNRCCSVNQKMYLNWKSIIHPNMKISTDCVTDKDIEIKSRLDIFKLLTDNEINEKELKIVLDAFNKLK